MFWVRFRSSVILMAIAILALVFGGWVLFGVVLFISLVGMMELNRILDIHKSIPAFLGYLACILFQTAIFFEKDEWLFAITVGFFLVLMIGYVLCFPKYVSNQITMVFFSFFYCAVMLSYLCQVRALDGGAYLVWLVLVSSWGSDTCAYLVGASIGKHKIIPKLSPKKSLEGYIGGVAGAALIGVIFAEVFREQLTIFTNPVVACGVIGAAGSVLSQIGDWAASAIKRNHDIKDYGTLIKGHGGVMDRFDSVIFTAPMVYYLIVLLAK